MAVFSLDYSREKERYGGVVSVGEGIKEQLLFLFLESAVFDNCFL